MRWRAARSPSSPSRRRPRASSAALARIKEYARPRRKRLLVVEDNAAEQMSIRELLGHDDIEIVTAGTGADGAGDAARQPVRLRRARSAAAGHDRLRGAGRNPRRRRRCRTCRSWCSPAGSCRPRRTRSCTPWRAASSSRASNCRSGCSTRPRCSCTAWSPTCRPRSSGCSSGSTAPTRIWSAGPCCWSTTTRATSSRSRSVLERRGMKVLTATTGREAIALVEIDTRTRDRADGHHDAGNGRLSDDRQ